MATFSREFFSESPSGAMIRVGSTGSPGTRIHTANDAPTIDELHIWATNVTNAAALLTIEFGGLADPGDHLVHQVSLPANSLPLPIATGQMLTAGLAVTVFSNTSNAINVSGYVNRVTR